MATLSGLRRALLLALGIALLVSVARARLAGDRDVADARPGPPPAAVPAAEPEIAAAKVPPPARPEAATARAALACPDGTTLPLLNGVSSAPPIRRPAHLGPLPPVVGRVFDDVGDEWYQHADGSTTTTRWRTVIWKGAARRTVETLHNAKLPQPGRVRPARAERGLAGSR